MVDGEDARSRPGDEARRASRRRRRSSPDHAGSRLWALGCRNLEVRRVGEGCAKPKVRMFLGVDLREVVCAGRFRRVEGPRDGGGEIGREGLGSEARMGAELRDAIEAK